MGSDNKELNAGTARALMSLIRLTEALEDGGCIISPEGSVAARLLPEILAVAAAKAKQEGGADEAVRAAIEKIVELKTAAEQEKLYKAVSEEAGKLTEEEGIAGCLQILKEFDRQMLEKDRDFYIKRGGADIGLSAMYEESVNALTKIMLKG